MTEGSSLESKVAQLTKEIDSQARFTRTLMVVCTLAILAANAWIFVQTIDTLPTLVVTNFMQNMEKIVLQWNATEERTAHKPVSQ